MKLRDRAVKRKGLSMFWCLGVQGLQSMPGVELHATFTHSKPWKDGRKGGRGGGREVGREGGREGGETHMHTCMWQHASQIRYTGNNLSVHLLTILCMTATQI